MARKSPTIDDLAKAASVVNARSSKRVFVVHGHDNATKESVARFLTQLKLEPIILHEQASGGKTIIEKFETHANVSFAVVLLTPDDLGASATKPENKLPRARQNVVFELGFFVGRLGRSNVCALHKGNVEIPSDYQGVIYIPLDENGGWRLMLASPTLPPWRRESPFESVLARRGAI